MNALLRRILSRNAAHNRDLYDIEKLHRDLKKGLSIHDLESTIRRYFDHPRWEVRNTAVKVAGDSGSAAFAPALCRFMTDRKQKGFVRRNAATALRSFRGSRAEILPELMNALGDSYWEVRAQAALTIAEIAEPDAALEGELIRRLFRTSPSIIHHLPYFFPLRVYRERDFEVRAALTRALGAVATSSATLHVLELLTGDSYWQVREAAIESLFRSAPVLGVSTMDLLQILQDLDLTCPDFRPKFPIRETWNRLKGTSAITTDADNRTH